MKQFEDVFEDSTNIFSFFSRIKALKIDETFNDFFILNNFEGTEKQFSMKMKIFVSHLCWIC